MASQSLFDLFQLDAEAANLDLIVGPSQKLNISIGAIADEIAGLVELLALEVVERIGNEFFGAKLGPLDVTTRHASASKMQLSGHADRNRLEELIQNIGSCIRNRPPDQNSAHGIAFIVTHVTQGDCNGRLGWTIRVHQPHCVANDSLPRVNTFRQGLFAADDYQSHRCGERQLLSAESVG